MTEYIKKEYAILSLMGYFISPEYTGEEVEQAKNLTELIINRIPTEEIVECEDAIDRYSVLAILHPCSVEYEEVKNFPSVLIKSPKQEVEEDRMTVEALGKEYRPGKWIVDRYCSECEWDKQEASFTSGWRENYCPNCGARMERDEK